jgi:hypothetical protein
VTSIFYTKEVMNPILYVGAFIVVSIVAWIAWKLITRRTHHRRKEGFQVIDPSLNTDAMIPSDSELYCITLQTHMKLNDVPQLRTLPTADVMFQEIPAATRQELYKAYRNALVFYKCIPTEAMQSVNTALACPILQQELNRESILYDYTTTDVGEKVGNKMITMWEQVKTTAGCPVNVAEKDTQANTKLVDTLDAVDSAVTIITVSGESATGANVSGAATTLIVKTAIDPKTTPLVNTMPSPNVEFRPSGPTGPTGA